MESSDIQGNQWETWKSVSRKEYALRKHSFQVLSLTGAIKYLQENLNTWLIQSHLCFTFHKNECNSAYWLAHARQRSLSISVQLACVSARFTWPVKVVGIFSRVSNLSTEFLLAPGSSFLWHKQTWAGGGLKSLARAYPVCPSSRLQVQWVCSGGSQSFMVKWNWPALYIRTLFPKKISGW